jgi:phospholipid/cholesterol/gamma-HCH transport system permease protein
VGKLGTSDSDAIRLERNGTGVRLVAAGEWTVGTATPLYRRLKAMDLPEGPVTIDLDGVERMDTAGAWLAYRAAQRWQRRGREVEVVYGRDEHRLLLEKIAAAERPSGAEPPSPSPFAVLLAHVGEAVVDLRDGAASTLGFIGVVVGTLARTLVRPGRLRFTALVSHMETAGVDAIPIVALISFLIGIVLAYQGADQLALFGAQIFVVNLVGVSILREIGILLTSIVVAGRSSSAYAAAIGSMKLAEEVDAMRALGLDPIERLVLPRVLALVLMLPCLVFISDLMGLFGGGLMAWVALDMPPVLYLERLQQAVSLSTFFVGLVKAPFFAFVIGVVGCRRGLEVKGSAESLGAQTTRAVVESIFLVIVLDAVFSIFFSSIGL